MVLIPPESRARRNPPPSLPPRAKRPERKAPANSRSNNSPVSAKLWSGVFEETNDLFTAEGLFRPKFGPHFVCVPQCPSVSKYFSDRLGRRGARAEKT